MSAKVPEDAEGDPATAADEAKETEAETDDDSTEEAVVEAVNTDPNRLTVMTPHPPGVVWAGWSWHGNTAPGGRIHT